MYEQAFRNIDDTLWKDAGCSSEMDYIEQTSWVLFLKYLDDYEQDKQTAAELNGTDIHTLAKQMGTSVLMLERFYSKLNVTMAAARLA